MPRLCAPAIVMEALIKENAGKALGNERLAAEGQAQRLKGKAQSVG